LQEVELYAFASNSAQFYLTPHEFDVDLDGNRYRAWPSNATNWRWVPRRPSRRWN
jgi:hypothetical protein